MARTVLLIDYDPRSIGYIRPVLQSIGLDVQLARDGRLGIEKFHALHPDLVLVQDMVPKMHGFDVCREIKGTDWGQVTPVILLATLTNGRRREIPDTKSDACIEKPVRKKELIDQIYALLPDLIPAPPPPVHKQPAASMGWSDVPFDADEEEINRTVDDVLNWTQPVEPEEKVEPAELETVKREDKKVRSPSKPLKSAPAKTTKRKKKTTAKKKKKTTTRKKKVAKTAKKKTGSTTKKKKVRRTKKAATGSKSTKRSPVTRKRRNSSKEAPSQQV